MASKMTPPTLPSLLASLTSASLLASRRKKTNSNVAAIVWLEPGVECLVVGNEYFRENEELGCILKSFKLRLTSPFRSRQTPQSKSPLHVSHWMLTAFTSSWTFGNWLFCILWSICVILLEADLKHSHDFFSRRTDGNKWSVLKADGRLEHCFASCQERRGGRPMTAGGWGGVGW